MMAMAQTLPHEMRLLGDGAIPAERLNRLELPCLVMAGGASPAWMRTSAAEVARAIPGSRYVVLPGQTHQAAPQLLAEQLLEFIRR